MKSLRANIWYLLAALLVLAAALAPPTDRLADASFASHMTQHLLLLFVVPLFVLLAHPFSLVTSFADKRVTATFVRSTRFLHALASPPLALLLFTATLWLTHFTGLYQASLQNQFVHVAEHALYFTAGTIFWLPVLAPPPLRPLNYPARLLYLAVALPQGALVAMAIDSARAPLYAHYASTAGSMAAALADQRDAAAVMWIGGGLIVFLAFLLTLATWARREAEAPA